MFPRFWLRKESVALSEKDWHSDRAFNIRDVRLTDGLDAMPIVRDGLSPFDYPIAPPTSSHIDRSFRAFSAIICPSFAVCVYIFPFLVHILQYLYDAVRSTTVVVKSTICASFTYLYHDNLFVLCLFVCFPVVQTSYSLP